MPIYTQEHHDQRECLFGPKLPIDTLIERAHILLDNLGETTRPFDDPDTTYVSKRREVMWFEEALHELAHHIALGPAPDFNKKRTRTIGSEIASMTPMQADGNELDALAIELNAAWWLKVPIYERPLVIGAASGNLNYFTAHTALRTVRKLRTHDICVQLGRDLAYSIKGAKRL